MRLLLSILMLVVIVLATAAPSISAVILPHWSVLPHYTTFDGRRYDFRATDGSGAVVADGPHTMTFSAWDHETAGSMLWTEVQTVVTSNGLGSAVLGEVVPMPLDILGVLGGDTTTARYIEITLDGEVLSPRTRLVSVPYANAAERVLGDIETSNGHLRVSNIGSSGLDGVSIDLDAQGDQGDMIITNIGSSGLDGVRLHVEPSSSSLRVSNLGSSGQDGVSIASDASGDHLTVANIGSSGLDGVSIDLDAQDDTGTLIISNIGSSGQDGVRCVVEPTSSSLHISNLGSSGQDGVRMSSDASGEHLTVSNIGSSGLDGVSIDIGPPGQTTTSSKLFVGGLSLLDRGAILTSDLDSSGIEIAHRVSGISSGTIRLHTSSTGGHLTVSNIGSSGEDGVSIAAGTDTAEIKLGIEHEDIGVRMHTMDEGSGPGLTITDSTGDSAVYAMNKAELVETLATNTQTTRLHSSGLTISNIGSSGQDGVSIEGGGGGGGRIALRDLSSAQTIETEIVALSLNSSEPILVVRERDAAPSDLPILRLEYDALGRVVETRLSTASAPGDSSQLSSSSLHLYDGLDRIILDADPGPGSGGRVSLATLQSGQTVQTEIIAMSLSSSEPYLGFRHRDALPSEPFVTEYVYDSIDRRVRVTHRSDFTQPGDSSQSSSTGTSIFDAPYRFDYDIDGILFTDASGPSFSVSRTGVLLARGTSSLALDPASSVEIGGSFPGVKLFVDGAICATGPIGPCSDVRYKENIETIANPLDKISQLRGVSFDWKTEEYPEMNFTDQHQIGLIAQEVEKVLPEVVGQGDNGYYFVDYSRLTPVLIEAVKQQQATIDKLTKKSEQIDELTKLVSELSAMVNDLLARQSNSESSIKLTSMESSRTK